MTHFYEYESADGDPTVVALITTKYVVIVCNGSGCGIIWHAKNNGSEIPYPLQVIDMHECPS